MAAIKTILFLPSWFPTSRSPLNGVFNRELADRVSKTNNVKLVFINFEPGLKSVIKRYNQVDSGLTEVLVNIPYTRNPIKKGWQYFREFRKIIRDLSEQGQKPDLIHVQVAWKMGLIAWLYRFLANVPYIVTEHYTGYLSADGELKGWKKWMSINLLKSANGVAAVSDGLRDRLRSFGVKDAITIPNFIHEVFFALTPAKRRESNGMPLRFIHVSNFNIRQKQTDKIIDAFKKVHARIPNSELVLVVPGKEFRQFLTQHPGLDIHGITHLEPGLFREHYAGLMSSCDALVSYSNFETFGLTIAEALCLGVPVIYTKCGGPEYFVEEGMGICVDPNDENTLISAMEEIQFTIFDRAEIAKRSRAKFDAGTILKSYDDLYNSVLKN